MSLLIHNHPKTAWGIPEELYPRYSKQIKDLEQKVLRYLHSIYDVYQGHAIPFKGTYVHHFYRDIRTQSVTNDTNIPQVNHSFWNALASRIERKRRDNTIPMPNIHMMEVDANGMLQGTIVVNTLQDAEELLQAYEDFEFRLVNLSSELMSEWRSFISNIHDATISLGDDPTVEEVNAAWAAIKPHYDKVNQISRYPVSGVSADHFNSSDRFTAIVPRFNTSITLNSVTRNTAHDWFVAVTLNSTANRCNLKLRSVIRNSYAYELHADSVRHALTGGNGRTALFRIKLEAGSPYRDFRTTLEPGDFTAIIDAIPLGEGESAYALEVTLTEPEPEEETSSG